MAINIIPLQAVQRAATTLPSDVAVAGPPLPALDRLRLMSPSEWEDFVLEWAHSLKDRYAIVERCGGAGDMGRDVIAIPSEKQTDIWDNYQCKHYDHALQPGDIWLELGKVCYYTMIGEYSFPRSYFFIAPQGVGNSLSKLLRAPDSLKTGLTAQWEDKCRSKITQKTEIQLDDRLQQHIESLDFSRFGTMSPLSLIEQHRKTPWHVARFGGGLPARPPVGPAPAVVADNEANYVRALLDAYEDRLKVKCPNCASVPDGLLKEHLERCRHEFYSAESLRAFSKDNVPSGTYDALLEDVHSGVIDVVHGSHPDAVERVLSVVKQAKSLSLSSNALSLRTTSSDKGGMCHQLANDQKIAWKR